MWVENDDMASDNGVHFPTVGRLFVEQRNVRTGRVGEADALLFSTTQLVDFARSYFASELE